MKNSPAYQHLHARAIDAEAAAHALREDNDQLRERVAVYAQVIHELRTELDRRTDNTAQRSPVRSLPTRGTAGLRQKGAAGSTGRS
jgi:hypothetical protein